MFLAIAVWRYLDTGYAFYFVIFGYIGLSIGLGAFLSRALVRNQKPWGRRISQLLVGLFMLGFLGFLGHENMQLEGFFFYLFAGVFHGAALHYVIAKLIGPIIFGRAWCGWACWTMMFLDLFPWRKPEQGRVKYLGLFRYLHFALSFGLIYFLFYMSGYGFTGHRGAELEWLVIGNVIYYLLAIGLTVTLRDNRAFCKYVCPIPATMKPLSRFSLLKQQIDMDKCNDCGLCVSHCLMDIKLLEYAHNNNRILSSECVLCDSCVNVCPTEAIKTTWRLDVGWRELIGKK
jgi:polyferredoxin